MLRSKASLEHSSAAILATHSLCPHSLGEAHFFWLQGQAGPLPSHCPTTESPSITNGDF